MLPISGESMKKWAIVRRRYDAYIFIIPSALVMAIFIIYPIVQAFWMSLHDWSFVNPEHTLVGIQNYAKLIEDWRFWNSLRVTAIYTIFSVPLQIGLGLFVAIALNQSIRGVNILRSAYFFPVISSFAVMAIVWKFLLNPNIGIISHWFVSMGFPQIDWLRSTIWALPTVIFTGVWKNIGFTMVILLAGLQGISERQYEAAAIDGAGRWARFIYITIPGLRQSLLFVLMTAVIASLQVFDQVYVMTRGGPLYSTESTVTYMYHQAFVLFNMGYGTAVSWILFLVIMVISITQLKFFRYHETY